MNHEPGDEVEETLIPEEDEQSQTDIEPRVEEKGKLVGITKKDLGNLMQGVMGIEFKFGEAVFKFNHCNTGKLRITAECINPIIEKPIPNVFEDNKPSIDGNETKEYEDTSSSDS